MLDSWDGGNGYGGGYGYGYGYGDGDGYSNEVPIGLYLNEE